MFELNRLSKSFGGVRAVDQVSLFFEKGKIISLVGPNGAGKTTLFNIINGFLKPDSGDVIFKGKNLIALSPWQIANTGIGRLFQGSRVFEKMLCLDNILLSVPNQIGENPFNALLKRKKVQNYEKNNMERARKWLQFVGLSEKENSFAENLSFGQQRLLSLSCLLMGEYDLLLLDEPTAGINPEMIGKILKLIRNIAREQNKTIFLIEHNLKVVSEVSDWLYFMAQGKIEAFGKPEDVLSDRTVQEAYLGL